MKTIKNIITIIILTLITILFIDFVRFPECYLTTWKYQLKNDIERGNEKAIEYYNKTYVKHNRILFK